MTEAFFAVHSGLDREGPGEPGDVAWAVALARTPADARICDAGCGPGADIAALLDAAPGGHVTAIDTHPAFIEDVIAKWGGDPRVSATVGSMAGIAGPFDLIWCAGALCFLGVAEGLRAWRPGVATGGAVAFSEPCWFTDTPSPAALDFWAQYPAITDAAGIDARVRAAGYRTVGTRVLSDAAWEAYYTPMEARIAALSTGADDVLRAELEVTAAEIAGWRATRRESGYLLSVVRPQ